MHGGASCMNFGKLCIRDRKPRQQQRDNRRNKIVIHTLPETSVHAIWLHHAGINLFNRLLVGHHPSLVYDVTFDDRKRGQSLLPCRKRSRECRRQYSDNISTKIEIVVAKVHELSDRFDC